MTLQQRGHHDLVVVGGGSSGCVVAARASEDEHQGVLLLEAGPDPQPLPDVIAAAERDAEALLASPYLGLYPTERPIDGSVFHLLAGRMIGGGSSVNFMSFMRPTAADCDAWAEYGGDAWSFEALLPLLRKIESDLDFPEDPLHGRNGPVPVQRLFDMAGPMPDASRAFVQQALTMGVPTCADLNSPAPFGLGATPSSIKDGRRYSSAVAYLDPARSRPNLVVESDALVTSMSVVDNRVTRIRYVKHGVTREVEADRVVLSAGVFHSPQILMLSGIGPTGDLRRLGIEPIHSLPGVGADFHDHATVFLTYEGVQGFEAGSVLPKFRILAKTDPSRPQSNMNVFMRPPTEIAGMGLLLPVSIHLLEHRTSGRLRLQSADPTDLPLVDTSLLKDSDDVQALVSGMRWVAELCGAASLQPWYGRLLQPSPDDDWATFAQSTFISYDHGVATCRMGPGSDAQSVVDANLKVHGIDNLWVADASVLPLVPHVNTNASAILVGEQAALSLAAGRT